MASVHDVAAYILQRGGTMSTMKLQKLAYYAQAWHLVWAERPLFDAEIQAWANGPVVKALYAQHRGQFNISEWRMGDASSLAEDERATIDSVVDAYGKYSGQQLSELSHREDPWRTTRDGLPEGMSTNRPIPLDKIQEYYSAVAASSQASNV